MYKVGLEKFEGVTSGTKKVSVVYTVPLNIDYAPYKREVYFNETVAGINKRDTNGEGKITIKLKDSTLTKDIVINCYSGLISIY